MQTQWQQRPFLIALALIALIPIAFAIHSYQTTIANVPIADQWCDAVPMVIDAADGNFQFGRLFKQHSAHRIFTTSFITLIFSYTTHWNLEAEAIVNFVLMGLIYAILLWMLWREHVRGFAFMTGAILFSALLFNPRIRVMWLWAYAEPYLFSFLALFLIIVILQTTRPGWIPISLIVILSILSTYNASSGFIFWIMVPLGLLAGGYRKWYHYVVWGIAAVAVYQIFFTGFVWQEGTNFCNSYLRPDSLDKPFETIGLLLVYLMRSLASPLLSNMYQDMPRTIPIGIGITVIFLLNLIYVGWKRWQARNWLSFFAWGSVFTLGAFGMTAIGLGRGNLPLVFMFWSNYTLQPTMMILVIGALAVMASAIVLNQTAPRSWEKALLYINAISLALFAFLYINVTGMSRNYQIYPHNSPHYLYPSPANEQCLRNYFFVEQADEATLDESPCWRDFAWYGFVTEADFKYYVQRLAELRYAAFGEIQFELPGTYLPDTPIVVDLPLAAQHLPVADEQGNIIDEALIYRMVADETQVEPLERQGVQNIIVAGDVPALLHFWYISDETIEGNYSFIWHHIFEQFVLDSREPYRLIPVYYGAPPPTETRPAVQFGDVVQLENWSMLNAIDVKACDTITVESWWTALQDIDKDYSMALVVVNAQNEALAQADKSLGIEMETGRWKPDSRIYWDRRILEIPCDTAPGQYPIITTVYDYREPDDALPTQYADGTPIGEWAYLTTLNVIE